MVGITWSKAEHQPRRQDIEGLKEQCRPTFLGIDPFYDFVYLRNIELNTQDIISQIKDPFESNYEETDDNQHFDGWERYLAVTTDVVTHQIARAPYQLNKRIQE